MNPEGGNDIAEDIPGAIAKALTLQWQSRAKFLVLLTDAPGHGILNGDQAKYSDNGRNSCDPEDAVKKLRDQKIEFMFARIRGTATRHMETLFRKWYDDDKIGVQMKSLNLFTEQSEATLSNFHFVFCLDESGSMSGQPWESLMQAYRSFLSIREKSQGSGDFVSVSQFNESARITVSRTPLSNAPRSLTFGSGGTCFAPALDNAKTLLSPSNPNVVPVLVFMTDGQNGDGDMSGRVQALISNVPKLKCFGIYFGDGSPGQLATMFANGRGHVQNATNGMDLIRCFESIARDCSAMQSLADGVAQQIGKEVFNKIVIDYM